VLAQVTELFQREGRVSYRVLNPQFSLGDDYIEDLKEAKALLEELVT
jgi:hypothetical protein